MLIAIITSAFFIISGHIIPRSNNQRCVELIKNHYQGISEGDYKKAYDSLYRNKFASYSQLSEIWKDSFDKIKINSIDKYDTFHEHDKKKFVYKLDLFYFIKENPSKYLTISKENHSDIVYIIIETNDVGSLKISKIVHVYDKKTKD